MNYIHELIQKQTLFSLKIYNVKGPLQKEMYIKQRI